MAEPLSEERLAQLRDDLQQAFDGVPFHYGLTLGEQKMLMREVDRLSGWRDIAAEHLSNQITLEAENAAMRHTLNEIEMDLAQASLESSYPIDMLPAADAQLFAKTTAARLARLHTTYPKL